MNHSTNLLISSNALEIALKHHFKETVKISRGVVDLESCYPRILLKLSWSGEINGPRTILIQMDGILFFETLDYFQKHRPIGCSEREFKDMTEGLFRPYEFRHFSISDLITDIKAEIKSK